MKRGCLLTKDYPVAAMLHGLRLHRIILDPIFRIKVNSEQKLLVNETISLSDPRDILNHTGVALPRCTYVAVNAATENLFLFAKVDMKGGFW